MKQLKVNEIIKLIEKGEVFEATDLDHGFKIKINKYVPYCCMAIHDGSNLRFDLKSKIALDEYERWYEEDPFTGDFIDSLPITLIGLDSRFEYDLNRSPENCIYEEAWGKNVWKKKLSPKAKQVSLKKHENFYKVVHAIVSKLSSLFQSCIVYDIHSYNYKRWERPVPLFNIGIERLDASKFEPFIHHWQQELELIKLPQITTESKINDVFYGRGYNLEYITKNFPEVLVLATEIKKVYCNEESGEAYPEIIESLKHGLKQAIINNVQLFSEHKTNWKSTTVAHLLDKKEDRILSSIDKKLFYLLKNFELLATINPSNTPQEKKKFLSKKATELPRFKYAPIKINALKLKKELVNLPTHQISDISIRNLYESVIESYLVKIDLISSLGQEKFLYNSLRYFGRPTQSDLQNANYLIHLPPLPKEPRKAPLIKADEAKISFENALNDYGISSKISLSSKILSQAMVLNSKKTILIRPDAHFTAKQLNALIEHEIGVHMVTTQNANNQKLKVFALGLPVNTMTQEGLAILAEYLSGNITLGRLRILAIRVVLTDMMCNGANFIECFNHLTENLSVNQEDAFLMVTRIFRGGGFTKDHLYLKGFVEVLKLWKSKKDLAPLMVGKTSLEFYDVLEEMINRDMILRPQFITKSFTETKPHKNKPIYDYIISGLQ